MKFRSLILPSFKFGKGGKGRPFFIFLSLSVTLVLLLENDISSQVLNNTFTNLAYIFSSKEGLLKNKTIYK
jgi:hypothetical protein